MSRVNITKLNNKIFMRLEENNRKNLTIIYLVWCSRCASRAIAGGEPEGFPIHIICQHVFMIYEVGD